MSDHKTQTLKQELLALTEVTIEETLEWDAAHPQRSFDEIEGFVLQIRKRLGQRLAQALCEEQAAQHLVPGPACPKCGQEMHYKGKHPRRIGSLVSDVEFIRSYYHCDHCKDRGIFPPG